MLKVKLHNAERDKLSFHMLLDNRELLKDCGIDIITNDSSYDVTILGFKSLNKYIHDKSYQECFDMTHDLIERINGPIWIWDTDDSASLIGVYEHLKNPKIQYVFKQFLKSKDDYEIESVFGRSFWKDDSHKFSQSYKLSNDEYNKLKLTGYNHGHHLIKNMPEFVRLCQTNITMNEIRQRKMIHINGLMQLNHPGRKFYNYDSGHFYTKHRQSVCDKILKLSNKNRTCIVGQAPFNITNANMSHSLITISPAGMGASCFRDFEAIANYSILCKSELNDIITYPNIFINSYVQCNKDYDNLDETISEILENYNEHIETLIQTKSNLLEIYSNENWIRYFINTLNKEDN